MADLPLRVCVVCGREYRPESADPFRQIYCTARCAWSGPDGRSRESLQREVDALTKALAEEPS